MFIRLIKDRVGVSGAILLVAMIIMATFAPFICPHSPNEQHVIDQLKGPNSTYWLGADQYGRDVFSRLIWAARPSLFIGVFSVAMALTVGLPLGITAGYFGGTYDHLVMRLTDILMSFPPMVLGIMVAVVLGGGIINTSIAISITFIPGVSRLARGSTLSIREESYIEAEKAIGSSSLRLILRHLLPNIIGPIIVMSTLWIAQAIRTEAGLSFLGLGVQPPTPSWGNMLRAGMDNFLRAPHLAIFPGIAIVTAVLAFNLLGDSLRDQLDPTLRG